MSRVGKAFAIFGDLAAKIGRSAFGIRVGTIDWPPVNVPDGVTNFMGDDVLIGPVVHVQFLRSADHADIRGIFIGAHYMDVVAVAGTLNKCQVSHVGPFGGSITETTQAVAR